MTLTNRLTLFFLVTLAFVLAGFSTTLYVLARVYLHRQAEERLEAALNTLVAAAELAPDGVEWEATDRRLAVGPRATDEKVVWLVRDAQGAIVDRSVHPGLDDFLVEASHSLQSRQLDAKRLDWLGGRWQVSQRLIRPAQPRAALPTVGGDNDRKYTSLTIIAGIALEPVRASLHYLAGVLTGLSLLVWLVAMFAGRALCRRGLLPLRRMTSAARDMDAGNFEERLPVMPNRDELGDLSRAFNGLLDRQQQSFVRQQRFTGEASHQLRTPLAAVLGEVEIALRGQRPVEEYRLVLTTVQEQAERLRKILESLLFLARADAETLLPERERLDLAQWLPAHLATWSEHPRAKDMVFENGAPDPPRVMAQPALLGELVDVLLSNACKYSIPGTPITVRLDRDKSDVCLTVADRGYGIEQQDMPQLFSPFFRSGAARDRGIEGLGLGLSIARRLAQAFGGSLRVASQPGQSVFTLRLPRA